jgi:histidine ammonia-lyase
VYSVMAIELVTAAQALHFRRPLKSSPKLEEFVHTFRTQVPFMETDRLLHNDLVKAEAFCTTIDL